MGKKKLAKRGTQEKLTYLSFVQANIARMSNYSCAIKGSCCVVVIGQLAMFQQAKLGVDLAFPCFVVLAATIFAFSIIDSKYLQLEKRNRVLYRLIDEADEDFPTNMELPAPSIVDGTRCIDSFLSWSVLGFYMILAFVCFGTAKLVLCA